MIVIINCLAVATGKLGETSVTLRGYLMEVIVHPRRLFSNQKMRETFVFFLPFEEISRPLSNKKMSTALRFFVVLGVVSSLVIYFSPRIALIQLTTPESNSSSPALCGCIPKARRSSAPTPLVWPLAWPSELIPPPSPPQSPSPSSSPLSLSPVSPPSYPGEVSLGTPYQYLQPGDIDAEMQKWAHLDNESLTVLADMLATRNENIDKYRNVPKVAHLALHGVDHRLGPGTHVPCLASRRIA
jgi:hypothetical protein